MLNNDVYFTNFLKKTNIKVKDEFLNVYKCILNHDEKIQSNILDHDERIQSLEQHQAGILDKLYVFTDMLDNVQRQSDNIQKQLDDFQKQLSIQKQLDNIQKQLNTMNPNLNETII